MDLAAFCCGSGVLSAGPFGCFLRGWSDVCLLVDLAAFRAASRNRLLVDLAAFRAASKNKLLVDLAAFCALFNCWAAGRFGCFLREVTLNLSIYWLF